MKRKLFIAALLSAVLLIAGCQSKNAKTNVKEEKKVEVVTTFYPMYEFTKAIAGNKANVSMLIPSSVEPHDWEPAAKDLEKIQSANMLVYNNENMETWIPTIQKSIDTTKVKFVDSSEHITLLPFEGSDEEEHDHDHDHEGEGDGHHHDMDPHVWLSPKMAIQQVETIAANLEKVDPANKDTYEANKKSYIEKLTDLDKKFKEGLANSKNKEIITQHAAFGYLAHSYGLKQVPIAGLSPDNEPSAKQLHDLKHFAEEHHISTIFFEENASSKVAETLAKELHAKTAVLNTLESVSDAEQKAGKSYVSLMEENLKILQDVLK